MTRVELRVLGPLTVTVDGAPVDLSSRKQRALLALLALRVGHVLSVDRLVDDLWGESPPATARHALQVYVSNLRKQLGKAVVGTEPPGYVLRLPAEACDAVRFEALTRSGRRALQEGDAFEASRTLTAALALWTGPALADLAGEPYAAQEALRLEEMRLVAAEDRISADLALGRHAELVGELEGRVVLHPLRERLWALLMLAAYRSGRQVEALRAYQSVRERLRDDLGLDPGPELQELNAAILRQDAALAAPSVPLPVPAAPEPTPHTAQAGARPESRRVASVVVAGLVGFDRTAGTLDPEDLRTLLDRCMTRLTSVVARYGGTVENVAAGELTAVLGAPIAHEDDPERAVRAAYDLQRAVVEHPDEFPGLGLCVGVSTGEVLLAAPIPLLRGQSSVVGDVVNQARRLQARAAAGEVLVSAATQAATRWVVEYRSAGAEAHAVVAVTAVKQPRPLGLTPLVGRDGELDLLLQVWRRCVRERRPQLVSVLGEPGVGKSRLLAEFQRAASADGRVLTGRCLPYGEALSYAPVAEAIRQAAGAAADRATSERERLDQLVAAVHTDQQPAADTARHLALLLGLDDDADRAEGLADERTLHAAARRFVEALARVQPLCLVLEDVHWADDALLDLVEALARRAQAAPLLVLTLARPELVERRTSWGGGLPSFTSITLQPLDVPTTRTLVGELGRAHALPDAVLTDISARSGGNPLFAEELVATVAEGGRAEGVPGGLTSLLLARLDALPPEQQATLQRASVFGMTFWPRGLAALARPTDEDPARDTMADLEHRDLLHAEPRSTLPGEAAFSFKHVLIRDAAYDSLPRQQRRALHRAAGEWLRVAAGERVGDFSDQLAHHMVESEQPERALQFFATAAERSRRAASHVREAALLAEALAVAATLGRHSVVAELHAQRGTAFSRLARWQEAREELEAALAGLPTDTDEGLRRRAEVHCDLSTASFWLFDTEAIGDHARKALALAERIGARDVQLAARAQLTNADSSTGQVDAVLAGGQRLIEDAAAWGIEPPYERLGTYSLQLYLTGRWEPAVQVARDAVRTGRERGDTQGALWNMPHLGMAAAAAGRYDEALAVFREGCRFGEEFELPAGTTRCIAMSAGFHLDLFDYIGAEEIQEEARDLGRRHFNPSAVSAGLDLMFNTTRRGDVGRAEALLDEVTTAVMEGQGWHGWLWRLRFVSLQAEMAAARGRWDDAAELAASAIETSSAKHRAKYEMYGRITLARALTARRDKSAALRELHAAYRLAEQLGNPALQVTAAGALLAVEPDDRVAAAGRDAVERVLTSLSDTTMRGRFLSADAVRTVLSG